MEPKKAPLAQAWDEWIESEDGAGCSNDEILKDASQRKYLKNRLWKAFISGAKAQDKITRDEIAKDILRQFGLDKGE